VRSSINAILTPLHPVVGRRNRCDSDAMPVEVTERCVIPDEDLVSSKVLLRFHLAQCQVLTFGCKERLKASCPGRLTDDGDLLVTSDRERDQHRNLEDAKDKLASLIRAALVPPKPRTPTKPSKGAKRRRLADKSRRADVKQGRGRVSDD
jgi:ribosome-associated protein